jgi:hypothetical protein
MTFNCHLLPLIQSRVIGYPGTCMNNCSAKSPNRHSFNFIFRSYTITGCGCQLSKIRYVYTAIVNFNSDLEDLLKC